MNNRPRLPLARSLGAPVVRQLMPREQDYFVMKPRLCASTPHR